MNEPANFPTDYLKCPEDEFNGVHMCKCVRGNDDLIQIRFDSLDQQGFNEPLTAKTICMDAVQGEKHEYRHYDVHSLYGWSESVATQR